MFKSKDTVWSFLGAFFSFVGTIGLVFVGLLGSIYTAEIKNSFPFRFFNEMPMKSLEIKSPLLFLNTKFSMHSEALVFYLFFLLFALLFIWGSKISLNFDAKIKFETLKTVELTYKKIAEGQILPSSDFLEDVHVNTQNIFQILNEYYLTKDKLTKTDIEGLVSRGLHSILALLSAYETDLYGESAEIMYGANIMTFYSGYKGNENEQKQIKKNLLFVDQSTDLNSLEGVLVFQHKLSASSRHPEENSDPTLDKLTLYLPVPKQTIINGKYIVLPGAPLAYLEPQSINRYEDTLHLFKWMDEQGDFLLAVKNAVNDYFSSDQAKDIRSFLSLPLVYKEQCVAVLNIHKNEPRLLYKDEQLNFFTRLLFPYCEALAELVGAWKIMEN